MQIEIKLNKNFTNQLDKLIEEYGTEFAKLNGFATEQLDYTDFIDNFIDTKVVADASIDSNANVSYKDIVSLENEMSKPHSRLLAYNKIFYEMNKKFGLKIAKEWFKNDWNGHLYMHDPSSASQKSYCYAYDLEDLVKKGLFFIDNFNHSPPKHLNTYTDFVGEFVSYCCNRSSGAVGLPSFLVYSYYFWKKDVENGYAIKNPQYHKEQGFQEIIYRLNQPFLRSGVQSSFTNFSIYDRSYMEALFGGKKFPDGSYIIDEIDNIIEYQKDFMKVCSKIRGENMMTFPVLTFCLLTENDNFVDEEFAKWCCEHNMKWADSNFFVSDDITSLSNCCRLSSNVKSLGYFNSIGGTALEVGSVKVNTINLARIAYETETKAQYITKLKKKTLLCLQALDVVRGIIIRNVEKGILPNYSLGLINIEKQYNTIGIIGIFEALQKFGYVCKDEFGYNYYTDEGIDFAVSILNSINQTKDEFAKDKDYMISIEQIPGENAASILMRKDKLLFSNETYDLPLYGNQWVPLGTKTTLCEKIRVSGILDKACSGGAISHINIESPFTDFDVAWNLLNYIIRQKVQYFAFCTKISACKRNHGFYGEVCPTCGDPKITTYQRIVGFLTAEKTYSEPRKEEFVLRQFLTKKELRHDN